jgi:hypothetical protein
MATSKDNLKQYFLKRTKPTEAQFSELIDAFRHVDDAIPVAAVNGLQAILNSWANTIAQVQNRLPIEGSINAAMPTTAPIYIPAGTLVIAVVIKGVQADGTLNIGSTLGGGEYESTQVLAGDTLVVQMGLFFEAEGELYIQSTVNLQYEIHR